jgi:hypothetical protein
MIFGWHGMRRRVVLATVAVVVWAASPAAAQTPPATCGADSLYLYSPATHGTRLVSSGRAGVELSWPDLDLEQATCFSLAEAGGFGAAVAVTGGFGDRVDRQLLFTAEADGAVGQAQGRNLIVNWVSEGSSTYGRLAGVLNLSNNGGVWQWDDSSGAWNQKNEDLPMTWRQANMTALARGAGGFMVAGLTRGSALQADPAGLFRYEGGRWEQVGADIFDAGNLITKIAVSPVDNDRFAVGTAARGLYMTSDGGLTFTNWTSELDPGSAAQASYGVSALEWTPTRLVAALSLFGVFVSTDGGAAFARSDFLVPPTLDPPFPGRTEIPTVMDFAADPADPDRLVAALWSHGCYETTDGGLSWHNLYGNLNVRDPDVRGAWVHNAKSVVIVDGAPETIIVGLVQDGLYRSTDGGAIWTKVALEPGVQPAQAVALQDFAMVNVPGRPGELAVFENGHGLLRSGDGGAAWTFAASQPIIDQGLLLLPGDEAGDLVLGTWGGGLYQAGGSLPLSDTYTNDTTPVSLRSLDLGLTLTVGAGTLESGSTFRVVAQTFQGWAVWRAPGDDPDNMTMLGLYDRVNPEDCIEGYCGDVSYEVVPRCFAAKRAACFDLSTPDTVRFFDDEIYNGFGYHYAVTSFDYGNTALNTPENNSASLVFSPRWSGDAGSPFVGVGNREFFRINEPAAAPTAGDEIYAYPNPVRLGAGFTGEEGRRVTFTNLPAGSRVRLFTTAGDDVNDLGPETQVGGQIDWATDNRAGEQVAAGVYLYKVDMPQRSAFWGRIAVIR